MRRRARTLGLAVVVLVLLASVFVLSRPAPTPSAPAVGPTEQATSATAESIEGRDLPAATVVSNQPTDASPRSSHAEQSSRTAILAAAKTRETRTEDAVAAARDPASPPNEPGALRDRIGGRDELVAALNEDFMPLADECITGARELDPSLEGMLALNVDVVADAALGAVIETVEFPATNEVEAPELLECIRATALSTILPPPGEDGREQFMLTLRVQGP